MLSGLLLVCVLVSSLPPVLTLPVVGFSPMPTIATTGSSGAGYTPNFYPPIQSVSGPQNTLAILVEFSDIKHTQDIAEIDDLIFREMAKYYYQVSYGQIQIVGKSVGWYSLSNSIEYYGADVNPQPGSDARKVELIKDSVEATQDIVVFKNYSRIMIVHAGIGQED